MTAAEDWGDTITVLHALKGKQMAKVHKADGTTLDYDNAFHYSAESVPVRGVESVADLLRDLLHEPAKCMVRGEVIPGSNVAKMRRLALPDKETGDAATLRDVPRRWLLVDADGVGRPDDVGADDLEACADAVMAHLPGVFQRTQCVVQASASHGIKPGCRLRLGFWCDRPMTGRELTRWLAEYPLDPSVFRAAQPIYSAAPLFEGRADHLPHRLLELPGESWLRCPPAEELADPPPQPPTPPERIARGRQANAYADKALGAAADAIMRAGEGKRHGTLVNEARSLARLVAANLLPERDLVAVLSEAARRAGKDNADEVASAIAWGLANPSAAKLPEASYAR